jgi:hypothetical protein
MRYPLAIVAVAAIASATARAPAQYELGGGDALDANTAVGSGGYNQRGRIEDYRARNLLVTDSVAGGRGFRGTVGYGAENDFRGALGSNDLFRERADSAFSSPTLLNSPRTMERMRFGEYMGVIEYRRSGQGSSLQRIGEQRFAAGQRLDDRIALDHIAISSTTSAVYESRGDTRIMGMLQDEEGQRIVASASSLFGVQFTPVERQGQLIGLTSYDMARALDDAQRGRPVPRIGETFSGDFSDLLNTASDLAVTGRIEPTAPTAAQLVEPLPMALSYRQVLERIAERQAALQPAAPAADEATRMVQLSEQFETLRQQLAEAEALETEAAETTESPGLSIDQLVGPLTHDTRIDQLSDGEQSRFQELLASGEQLLRDGEYFWAERRFERALRFIPGHPLATAGMGHAQLGAGLYAPAALTLRRLLTDRPEMIDVRYDPDLLPGRVRLNMAVQRLWELLPEQRDRALYAFLLAYIGHQLDRRDLIQEGLRILGVEGPEDPLRPLLAKIWLQ